MNAAIKVRDYSNPTEEAREYEVFNDSELLETFEVMKGARRAGTPILIRITGPDAAAAAQALESLFGPPGPLFSDRDFVTFLYASAARGLGFIRAGQLVRSGVPLELVKQALEGEE